MNKDKDKDKETIFEIITHTLITAGKLSVVILTFCIVISFITGKPAEYTSFYDQPSLLR